MPLTYHHVEHLAYSTGVFNRAPVTSRETEDRRFRSTFGCSSTVTAFFFNEYLEHHDEWKFQPIHLLWALCFMKTYLTYDVLCNWLSVGCHKTLKKWVWRVIDILQAINNLVS